MREKKKEKMEVLTQPLRIEAGDDGFPHSIREIPPYRGHSHCSGCKPTTGHAGLEADKEDDAADRYNNFVRKGKKFVMPEAPTAPVMKIRFSAIAQCSGNPEYVSSVATNRARIAHLQQQEAHAAAISQTMLNRRKGAAA